MTRPQEEEQSVRSRTENVRLTNSTLLPRSRSLMWGGSSTVCIEGVCQVPAQDQRVQCGEERLEQRFLGRYSIGGISLGRTLMMCHKPDGSGEGVELWHNSEFDIDFDVLKMPPQKGATYYRIDQISSSVPDDPTLFQVPPSGYSFR